MADVIELKITVEGGQEAPNQELTNETAETEQKATAKTIAGLVLIKKAIDITRQATSLYVSTISLRTGNSTQKEQIENAFGRLGLLKDIATGQLVVTSATNAIMYELNRKATNEVAYNMRVRAGYTANGNR